MFRTIPLSLAVAAIALGSLSACSSMQDKSAAANNVDSSKVVAMQDDGVYVAKVERVARARGIMLTWVNPPKKHPQPQQN